MTSNDDIDAALRFYYTMAVLIDSLADIRDAQQRLHQAQAACDAAHRLRSWTPWVASAPVTPAASARRWRQPGPIPPQQKSVQPASILNVPSSMVDKPPPGYVCLFAAR